MSSAALPPEPEVVIELPTPPEQEERAQRGWDRPGAKPAIAQDDEEELPDYDDDEEETVFPEQTVGKIIMEEFSLVFRTWVYVMRSWIEIPGKVFRIAIMELNRLWSYWLGLPVGERSWEIRWPKHEEL